MNWVEPLANTTKLRCKSDLNNRRIISFSLYSIAFLFFVISCQEDSTLKNVCADPIGSQDVTMQTNTQFCPKEGQNGCFITKFGSTTQVFQAINYTGKLLGMIVDVGPVTCLGQVTAKPVSGYAYVVDVVAKHGYVIMLPDGTYGRFFVDTVVKSSTGSVTKIYVTWQYAF